jgi:polyisoprenyl-teichoic acid--peptidoglycan teichoic acid transferase
MNMGSAVGARQHGQHARRPNSTLRVLRSTAAVVALVAVGYTLATAGNLALAWGTVERVELSESPATPSPTAVDAAESPSLDGASPARPTVVALVGSDSRDGLDDLDGFGDFDTANADVIVVAIHTGDSWTLLSIPRDLAVLDLCHGGLHKIGEALAGCGTRSGLAQLVLELESVTRLEIDHVAAVDLAGFQGLVDVVGGHEICVERPVRDLKSGLALEAGCRHANGATVLQWLRSRHTEELIDGVWRPVSGVSDLTRNDRQRTFLIDIFEQVTASADPGQLADLAGAMAPYLTVDDRLSLGDVAGWAWESRSSDLRTAELPVEFSTTEAGASVLVATVDIPTHVAELTGP